MAIQLFRKIFIGLIIAVLFAVLPSLGAAQEANQTVTINKAGEGISQALLNHYMVNLGMSEESAFSRVLIELSNSAFYRDGVLQDLVQVGDKITLDSSGSVIAFNSITPPGRLPESVQIIDSNTILFGNETVTLPSQIGVEMVANPFDQHNNLIIRDSAGTQHRVVAYAPSEMVLINGEVRSLKEWLGQSLNVSGAMISEIDIGSGSQSITSSLTGGEVASILSETGEEIAGASQSASLSFLGLSRRAWLFIVGIAAVVLIGLIWYYREDKDTEGPRTVGKAIDLGL